MTSISSIDNAPRNLEELAKSGRFVLRTLATQLGRFKTEESKAALMSLNNEQMAAEILQDLLELDKSKGKSTSEPAVAANKSAPQQPRQQPAEQEPAIARTPVINGSNVQKASQNGASAAPSQIAEELGKIAGALTNLNLTLKEELGEIKDRLEEIEREQERDNKIARGNNGLAIISMNLSLMLAEEVMKGPREDVLKAAIDDCASVISTLMKLDPKLEVSYEDDSEDTAEEDGDQGE